MNYSISDILYAANHYERPRHHLSGKSNSFVDAAPTTSAQHQGKNSERYYIYSAKKISNDFPSEDEIKSRKPRSSSSLSLGSKRTPDDRKTVSKNISMVLENLLMSYENSQLPTHGQGIFLFYLLFVIIQFTYFPIIKVRLKKKLIKESLIKKL